MTDLTNVQQITYEGLTAPMRDGVALMSDVYLPAGNGPWPVILVRTPYGRKTPQIADRYTFYADHGFAVVLQDCRGRFGSEGVYRPFLDDENDGFDTVAWAAAQPWSSGAVGMAGMSAMGINAYLAAMAQAPALKAAWISVARNPAGDLTKFPGGIYLHDLSEKWKELQGMAVEETPVPHIFSRTADIERLDLARRYGAVNIPIFHVGGWFDINVAQSVENFNALQARGGPNAAGLQRLAMGAFTHLGPSAGLPFPADAGDPDMLRDVAVRWFDHWLRGRDTGLLREPVVRYFVMGDLQQVGPVSGGWRTAATWPPPGRIASWQLQADGGLSQTTAGETESMRTFVYDPRDPIPTLGGSNLFLESGPLDQRATSSRDDVLRFVSAPLTKPIEVAGSPEVELWVSTDVRDTDFIVRLVDIYPDGYEALISDQGLRMRHRHGLDRQDECVPETVYKIVIQLDPTALTLNAGHRLGVFVQSSNATRFEPHSNSWTPVASYADALVARNSVHLGGRYPSALHLPLAAEAADSSHLPT